MVNPGKYVLISVAYFYHISTHLPGGSVVLYIMVLDLISIQNY